MANQKKARRFYVGPFYYCHFIQSLISNFMTKKKQTINNPFNYTRFATCIWMKREGENLTTRAVSESTGLPISTINRAEAVANELSMNTIIAICNWLNKPVQFFLTPVKTDKNGKGNKG